MHTLVQLRTASARERGAARLQRFARRLDPRRAAPVGARARRLIALALAVVAAAGTASANERLLRVNNLADATIIRLYVSPSGAEDWGADVLASGMLEPGESMLLDYDDGSGNCVFDVKALYTTDEVSTLFAVNFCEIDDLSFRP
jgi:hypothetical protein